MKWKLGKIKGYMLLQEVEGYAEFGIALSVFGTFKVENGLGYAEILMRTFVGRPSPGIGTPSPGGGD